MRKELIKKILIIAWLTILCFMLLGNVHAWEVPSYLRVTSGSRLWFSLIEGDLIQNDRTKLGISDNLGIKQDRLVWEYFLNARVWNIHVLRVKAEPSSLYDQSAKDSSIKAYDYRVGYDLDFYMSPQALAGFNADLEVINLRSLVNDVKVGTSVYNYAESQTRVVPSLGLHGSFYPILQAIALRPSVSGRVNWWDYESLQTWDWEVAAGVDIPVNALWTWTVNGGYRMWNVKTKRERDRVDLTRKGFFLETSVRF